LFQSCRQPFFASYRSVSFFYRILSIRVVCEIWSFATSEVMRKIPFLRFELEKLSLLFA
jgi:hypothetical protein